MWPRNEAGKRNAHEAGPAKTGRPAGQQASSRQGLLLAIHSRGPSKKKSDEWRQRRGKQNTVTMIITATATTTMMTVIIAMIDFGVVNACMDVTALLSLL